MCMFCYVPSFTKQLEGHAPSSFLFITRLSHFSASLDRKVGQEKNTQRDQSVFYRPQTYKWTSVHTNTLTWLGSTGLRHEVITEIKWCCAWRRFSGRWRSMTKGACLYVKRQKSHSDLLTLLRKKQSFSSLVATEDKSLSHLSAVINKKPWCDILTTSQGLS